MSEISCDLSGRGDGSSFSQGIGLRPQPRAMLSRPVGPISDAGCCLSPFRFPTQSCQTCRTLCPLQTFDIFCYSRRNACFEE
jgi:hypothetical protein